MSSVVETAEETRSKGQAHSVYGRPGDNERSLDIIQRGMVS